MISAIANLKNLIISTGNILNVNNQLGQKSNEELLDGLKLTLAGSSDNANNHVVMNEVEGHVLRATQELNQKLTENERAEISIGAKIFLTKNSSASIEQAMNALLDILHVQEVDNVVLSYHPISADSKNIANSSDNESIESEQTVTELMQLWTSLEKYSTEKKVTQLGISDLHVNNLSKLHSGVSVPPTIMQINLSSCCVVPPALQDFCNNNDIELLTHSDPDVLLQDEQFIIPNYAVDWILRYQVHLKCRGVLIAKGYIVGATKK